MKNLRVVFKLSLGFSIITLLLVVLGYIGITAMNTSQKDAATIESIYISELGIYNNLSRDVSDIGYNMILYLSSSDDKYIANVNKVIADVKKSENALKSLSQLKTDDMRVHDIAEFLKVFSPLLSEYEKRVGSTVDARKASLESWNDATSKAVTAVKSVDTYLEAVMDGIGIAGEKYENENVEILTALDVNTMALVSKIGEFRMNFTESYQAKNSAIGNELLQKLMADFEVSKKMQANIPYDNIIELAEKMNKDMDIYFAALADSIAKWKNESTVSSARAATYRDLLGLVKANADELITVSKEVAEANITEIQSSKDFFQIILLSSIVFALLLSFVLTTQITKPIIKCVNFAKEIAMGNLSYQMDLNQRDEFGQLADGLRAIPQNLNAVLAEYNELSNKISTGYISTQGNASKFTGDFKTLIEGTNKIIDNYLAIIENVPSAVVMLNSDQQVCYLNATGRSACGDAFSGKTCKQIMNRDDSGTADDALELAIRTRKPARGQTTAHPQGKDVHIKYFAVPMLDSQGNLLSIMQLILDVTEEKNLQQTILEVAHNATEIAQIVSSTAMQLSEQINQAELATQTSLNQMESTSVSMSGMNDAVVEVAHNSANASIVANDARNMADSGSKVVELVVSSIAGVDHQASQLKLDMQQLGQHAESITTIMNVISDIADQTNLLALNAAIEAARAGEAGRGFAVVADEVRKLAEKTMQATVEVGTAIRSVQSSVEKNMSNVDSSVANIAQATDQARQAGTSLSEILQLVDTSADQIRSIATAAEEQSASFDEINQSIQNVTENANTMSVTMGDAAYAVRELAAQASRLNDLIAQLQSTTG